MAYIKDSPTTDIATTVSEPSFVGGQASIQDYLPFTPQGYGLGFEGLANVAGFYSGDYGEANLLASLKPINVTLTSGSFGSFTTDQRYALPVLVRKDDHYVPAPSAVGFAPRALNYQDDQLVEFNSDNYFQTTPVEIVEVNPVLTITTAGTGYPFGTTYNATVTGGTGTGLEVDIIGGGGGVGGVTSAVVRETGSGYTHGDVVTIQGGNNDATLTLSITRFTVIMRDLTNTKLTISYDTSDQFVFVEGVNLGDEPNGLQSVTNIRFLKSRTDNTDNIASLAIAGGGSGYPAGVGFSTTTTGGSGTGLGVSVSTTAGGVINFVQSPPPAGTQGEGYKNGDEVTVVNPNGGGDATLTVATTRHSQVADITIANGVVTGLAVSNVGTGLSTGDLLEATLGNGAKVKFRYLNGPTEYHNFTAAILVQINTAAGHTLEVGDYVVVDHDNPATQTLGQPGFASAKKTRGEHAWIDEDAIYFFYRKITHANWNSPSFGDQTGTDIPTFVTVGGTGPAALAASDKMNENQMGITGSYNAIDQRLNPKFKAVKMTCASAWSIKESGSSTVINVAANAEHIFRYYGDNEGFFKAQTQGGGSATLNWQYFVG